VLAALKCDLQRRLGPRALADGRWCDLKRLPVANPALDVEQTTFATQLV
jgi:hypothetical protein